MAIDNQIGDPPPPHCMRALGTGIVVLFILCVLAVMPRHGVAAPSQAEQVFVPCKGCHLGYEENFIDPETGRATQPLVNPKRRMASAHAKVACQDCHTSGYNSFPHRNIKIKGCMDCHPRSDPAGAQADAAYDFARIHREFKHSIHFTQTKDKFHKNVDAAYGVRFHITQSDNGFQCSLCHHPHYMRTTTQLAAPMAILDVHNQWCTSCHAAEPSRPLNIMLGVDWAAIADPAKESLVAEHTALPFAARHLRKARCIDCHADANQKHSHTLLRGNDTVACASCHTRVSSLSHLYSYARHDTSSWVTNAVMLKHSYVMGATRFTWLDVAFYLALGAVVLMIIAHVIWRLISHMRAQPPRRDGGQ